MNHRLR